MLRRIFDEAKKYGGPTELIRQMNLNITLESRSKQLDFGIEARQRTIIQLDARLKQLLEYDREVAKAHEKVLADTTASKKRLMDEFDGEKTRGEKEKETRKSEISNLTNNIAKLNGEIQIGKWLLALISRDPEALELLKRVTCILEHEQPTVALTDALAYQFIRLAREDLTESGQLVPRSELEQAKNAVAFARLQSTDDRILVNYLLDSITRFKRNPRKMTTDQKRVILEAFAQCEAETQEGFAQLIKRLESSEKCAAHGTLMVFDYQQRQWICPTLSCSFRR